MNRSAIISSCGRYRYLLRREWGIRISFCLSTIIGRIEHDMKILDGGQG